MVKIQKVLLVSSLVTLGTYAEVNLVRKHQHTDQDVAEGYIEISDAQSLVRNVRRQESMEVDATGSVKTFESDSAGKLSPSSASGAKPQKSVEVEANGRAVVELGRFAELQKYGPYQLSRNALDYFKEWSNGNIAQSLKTSKNSGAGPQASFQEEAQEQFRSASGLLGLLHTTNKLTCVKSSRNFDGDAKLYKSTSGLDDVFHALLVLPDGLLQYAAVFRGKLIAAEPSLCRIAKTVKDLEDGDGAGAGEFASLAENQTEGQEAGSSHMLDAESDPTVKDCSDLFARTVQQQCGTRFEFAVISATEHVIDGIEIEMTLKVTERAIEYFHEISCNFEVAWDDQASPNYNQTQLLPEEEEGLVATMLFPGSVCEANQRSTSSETDSLKLRQNYGLGEISHYKGNEWMRSWYPLDRISEDRSTPSSHDIRNSNPKCFPGVGYSGPVRHQGNCGSSWAFAAASAAMTTLCAQANGGKHTVTGNTRYEISTQQIMSCNSQQRGCNGGWHHGADSAWKSKGLFRDRDFTYMCGRGSYRDHFDNGTSCDSWPWGKNCPSSGAAPYWKYSGMRSTRGEENMKWLISRGFGLYVTFAVYGNFFSYTSGVYNQSFGSFAGYHAVVALGYGNISSTKFWTLQNSWGTRWGENGYFKMKRGSNLVGIEDLAVYMSISSSAPSYTCSTLQPYRDCTEKSGRSRLSATSKSDCQTKCAQQNQPGCCEWQIDWETCYFQPSDRDTRHDGGMCSGRPCRAASMCTNSRSLLENSEDTMSSDSDTAKLMQAKS